VSLVVPTEAVGQVPIGQFAAVPGIVVLLLSYPVGRVIIHETGSVVEEWFGDEENENTVPVDPMSYPYQLKSWVVSRMVLLEDSEQDTSEESGPIISLRHLFHSDDWLMNDAAKETKAGVHSSIKSLIPPRTAQEAEWKDSKRYGHSLVYDRDSLYSKYETLATFFRNFSVSLFMSALILFIYCLTTISNTNQEIADLLGIEGSAPLHNSSGLLLSGLIFSILFCLLLSIRQYNKWELRKKRAFVNELHILLAEDDNLVDT